MALPPYSGYAGVYERFMSAAGVPYDRWADFISELIGRYGVSKPLSNMKDTDADEESVLLSQERDLVVDLGCGTGAFTRAMKASGYDVMGIDASAEMLSEARRIEDERACGRTDSGQGIMYLQQDMRMLDLYCTAGTMVSVYDTMNYLLTDEDMCETLRRINNFLYPGGVFIFDFNTLHRYRDSLGDTTFAAQLDDGHDGCEGTLIWENTFYDDERINEAELTFYIREDTGANSRGHEPLYRRFTETHYQRGWTLPELTELTGRAGMRVLASYDALTRSAPNDESERILMVAGEQGKLNPSLS